MTPSFFGVNSTRLSPGTEGLLDAVGGHGNRIVAAVEVVGGHADDPLSGTPTWTTNGTTRPTRSSW